MKKQPHLDRRVIHPFYGSEPHYIVLLLLCLPLIYCIFAFFKQAIQVIESQIVDATIYYNVTSLAKSGEGSLPVLTFIDPNAGEQRYSVHEPGLLSLIQNNPELSNIEIRYNIEKSGDISYLQLNNFWGVWGEAIALLCLGIVIIILILQLSPWPAWYWRHIDRRLALLSKRFYKVEVNVNHLENLTVLFDKNQRVCRLYAEFYINTRNLFIQIKSPKFLVESDFRMSYPLLDVYLNLKKPNHYEVDLKKFLKLNASSLHGYTEKDRKHFLQQSHKVG